MARADTFNIKKELTNFFRNTDIFSTTDRGVTTTTETFTGDGTTKVFTLSHTNLKNVRYVKLAGTEKRYGFDYDINFEGELDEGSAGSIIMKCTPQNGESLEVKYDYGNSDKIFPDYPRNDLSLSSYPRFGFDIIDISSKPSSIGGCSTISDILIEFVIYARDQKTCEIYAWKFDNCIYANRKNFYNFAFIVPYTVGPLIPAEDRENILHRNFTYKIINHFETDEFREDTI